MNCAADYALRSSCNGLAYFLMYHLGASESWLQRSGRWRVWAGVLLVPSVQAGRFVGDMVNAVLS
jgi:hypothetical protein